MSSLERIADELRGLKYAPFFIDTPQGRTVVIRYRIQTGKYDGERVWLGFSLQEEGYPEYPPHWIHISPPYDDQRGGSTNPYSGCGPEGATQKWLALSRPPGEMWDRLRTKHMKGYLDFHITRFCKNLK